FLLTSRYADDHAEIRYWEEARDLHDAAAGALRLWGEHRRTAGLPPWEIVGLEVIGRATCDHRVAEGHGPVRALPVGGHRCWARPGRGTPPGPSRGRRPPSRGVGWARVPPPGRTTLPS